MSVFYDKIQFNPFKHHLAFVCEELLQISRRDNNQTHSFFEAIKSINANFVDIYTGGFSPLEIQGEIVLELEKLNISNEFDFERLVERKGFQLLTLKDTSVWVIRKSEYKSAFVHIHPSRIPPLTIRVHGNAWRTVVGLFIIDPEFLKLTPALEQINNFRKEFLHLSPVKGNENLKRVMKVYDILRRQMADKMEYRF